MGMSRKDYVSVAEILKGHKQYEQEIIRLGGPASTPDEIFYRLAFDFGSMFRGDNERFDWDKFREACDVPLNWTHTIGAFDE
tara:strand:- start:609 stop:854 length:246 start_codon:yes stop_codon:yes gene_type:complete